MNPIDLAVCLILLFAAWRGFRRGLVMQACSLAGIVVAVWFAARHAADAGAWLGLEGAVAAPGGFAAIFVAALVVVGIAGRILGGLFRFAGFGLPDMLLGAAVSVAKYALVLGVLFGAFAPLNADWGLVDGETLRTSRSWEPLCGLSQRLLPVLDRARMRWCSDGEREEAPESRHAANQKSPN